MADGRRTRWVAHDVYFLDDDLGATMFDQFGAAGVALWHGFIAACKKNHVEGEITFASDAEALTIFGLPGMPLVDNDGASFDLADWLKLLSDHKVIRRTSRGRRLKVVCTRWGRWQQAARRAKKAESQAERRDDEGEQTRRSGQENTGTEPARIGHDRGPKQAQMTDTDTDTDTEELLAPVKPARKPREPDPIFDAVIAACGLDLSELTDTARGAANRAVKELKKIGATPEGIRARARVHLDKWPDATLTPSSLAKNYAQLGASPRKDGPRRDPDACADCGYTPDRHDDQLCAVVKAG